MLVISSQVREVEDSCGEVEGFLEGGFHGGFVGRVAGPHFEGDGALIDEHVEAVEGFEAEGEWGHGGALRWRGIEARWVGTKGGNGGGGVWGWGVW